jgi:hypothetical protein
LQTECERAFTRCRYDCEPELVLHYTNIRKHEKKCPKVPLLCQKCKLVTLNREDLPKHEVTDCNYIKVCEKCKMTHRKNDTHTLK